MKRCLLILLVLFSCFFVQAQDSIQLHQDSVVVQTVADSLSLSAQSELGAVRTKQKFGSIRNTNSNKLSFFIGLGTFLLFGMLRYLYAKHIKELTDILSRSTLGRMNSKESIWQNLMPRWLFLGIYFMAGGYVVGQLIAYFSSLQEEPIVFWFWGVLILLLGNVLKFLTVHAVALVFRFNKTATSFFNHISVVNQLMGMILLPICGILLLAPNKLANILLIIAGILLLISLIFKLLINVGHVRNLSKVSYFHFILYLCTLEFIPLAVFARYVYNGIGV